MPENTKLTAKLDAKGDDKPEWQVKFDSLELKMDSILAKLDAEDEKELSDEEKKKLLEKKKLDDASKKKTDAAAEIFRGILSKSVKKEKLDAWGYDELIIAMSLKEDAIPIVGNPILSKKLDSNVDTPAWAEIEVH